jgi:hypothetical protein
MEIHMSDEYVALNDPKIAEKVKKVLQDVSNQWTIIDGYKDTINETFKTLADETEVPNRQLRKLAKAYHRQSIQTDVAATEALEIIYQKVFGNE